MKKIVVPVDNSKVSMGAAVYAATLSATLKSEIILLSVINASSASTALINWRMLEEQMVTEDREGVAKMIKEIRATVGTKVKVTHRQVMGFPVHEEINRFVAENKVDLIVMGTGGASGLMKILTGTNTASVIDTSSVPVIAVPKSMKPRSIKKIIYATDMSHLDEEIKTIARFAKPFDADIDVVHLTGEGHRQRDRTELERILSRMTKYPKIHISVTKGVDVAKGLRGFATKHKADMIVMFTHKLDFFEKLLGKGNTRQVAFESAVPLLAFNRTNAPR